jgi:hypothetical protein
VVEVEIVAMAEMTDEFLVTGEQLLRLLEQIRNERPELLSLGVVMDARGNRDGETSTRGQAEAWDGSVFTMNSDESGYGQATLILSAMFLPSLLAKPTIK